MKTAASALSSKLSKSDSYLCPDLETNLGSCSRETIELFYVTTRTLETGSMGLCHSDSQHSIVSLRGGGYTTSTFQGLHKRCCGSGHKNAWGEEEGRGESAYETPGRRPPSAFECFGCLCGASRDSRVVVDSCNAWQGSNWPVLGSAWGM